MKVSVYVEQELFNQALETAKTVFIATDTEQPEVSYPLLLMWRWRNRDKRDACANVYLTPYLGIIWYLETTSWREIQASP